jgi:hypothetical protein
VTDLSTAAQQLQAVPLEDFVAERKRLAKELRDGGDRDGAAELAKLPKPTPPAWALNQLAREETDLVEDWLDAAEGLRDASTAARKGGGDALRAAMATHREATRALLGAARDRTRPNGRELSEQMLDRVRDLLQLATLDPGESERLRVGVIVEGADEVPPPPASKPRRRKPRARKQEPEPDDAATERARREAEEHAERERAVAAAEQALAELRAVVDEREAAAEKADKRLEDARRALHRSESEAEAARDAVREASDAAEQAERELRKLSAKRSS